MPPRNPLLATTAALAALVSATPAAAAVHTVAPGETLWGIAQANGLPASAIAAANGLPADARVLAGRNLTIPARGATATTAAPASAATVSTAGAGGLRVAYGDTLSGIAARNGVSVSALAAANGLDAGGTLLAGRTLRLPAAGAPVPAATAAPAGAPAPLGAYVVRPGDNLSTLAARSRVPLAQMAQMNGLDPSRPLLIGTVLKLPTGSPVQTSASAPAPSVVPAAAPVATAGRLTASQVGAIAAQHGASPSLAAAIGWQESGFNNGMVSSANARGIMQVLPGTWSWVQANLARTPLNPASATDNVRAGSLYLAHLMRQTGGDPAMAAAAYYQGLSSVRRIGMLPETRRYVANVLALRSRFGG